MGYARRGDGRKASAAAFASQVHPVFMTPPLAASLFGAVLAVRAVERGFHPSVAALHLVAMFCAVYTAHVKDGYVDFYGRGEDDDHPLTAAGCRVALAGATVGFAAAAASLWWAVGVGAALLSLPGWLFGYFHAPQLDTNPVTATMGYPLGVGVAILGGYYVQATALSGVVVAFAAVFVVVLSGIKVIDDAMDYEYDRGIDKRTVAVVVGRRRARRVAFGLMLVGMGAVVGLAAGGVFPPGSIGAAGAFAAVAAVAWRATDRVATMLLIRGSYVFLAVLVVAVWFRPFA